MTPIEIIRAAYARLADEHDEDPRSPLMQSLSSLMRAPQEIPDGEIELSATLQAGGVCAVVDQHGRSVKGVRSVTAFRDQNGRNVFQIEL